MPRLKKPIPILPWQAYCKLYFKKNSPLYIEIHTDHVDFTAGKEFTRSKYSHLFADLDEASLSTIKWLPFLQRVLVDRFKDANEAERAAVTEFIDGRYLKATNIYERPWDGYPGSENDSEALKKRKYLTR